MYLIHNTTIKYLKHILLDGELKSSASTGNLNEGYGIYDHHEQKFVYFSTVDTLDNENVIGEVTLYFNSQLLYNRTYYVGTYHSSSPNILDEDRKSEYKLKIPRYYKKTDTVLKKLYKQSVKSHKTAFQIFQQVAIKNKCDLKYLECIQFHMFSLETPINKTILQTIKKYYPNVRVTYKKINIPSKNKN